MPFRFGNRNLRLIALAKSVSLLGDEAAVVAMMLRLQTHGAGAGAVALLLMANLLPIVLLSPVVGRLIDSIDSRVLLVASSLSQAALCTVLAMVTSTAGTLALMAVLGIGQAVNGATWQSLVPATVEPAELPRAISLIQMGTTAAAICAPPLSGLLTGRYGARVPLLLDAGTFLAVTAAALLLRTRRRPVAESRGPVAGGLAIVRGDALLRPLFVLLGVFVLLGSMVNVVDVFLVRETLHASTTWYGLAGAAYSLGALTGAIAGGRLAASAPTLARSFVLSCACLAVGLAAMGSAPSVGWLLGAACVTGIANGMLNVTLGALVMGRARADERGRVASMLTGVASGTQLAAFAVGGALAGVLSPRAIFVLGGLLGLLAPVLLGRALLRAAAADPADWARTALEGEPA